MASSVPPSTVSTSSPGQTANQNSQSNQPRVPNGLYDIAYAYQQQTQKNTDKTLRFSLSVPNQGTTLTFNAHIDPNHLIISAEKRAVALDVLTGVVMQDFGYNAETLELKGTTGSAYYREIDILHTVFRAQSGSGIAHKVTVNIEGKTFPALWKEFVYERQITVAGGNIINYTMSFVVLPIQYSTSVSFDGHNINKTNTNSNQTLNQAVQAVTTGGKSAWQYLKFSKDVPLTKMQQAGQFIEQNYDPAANNGMAFPGLNIPLQPQQTINVPNNWDGYFG